MAVDSYHRQREVERVPQNPRLWEMLVVQAKQKFHPYPSLPASKWIHGEYVKRGGSFVDSKKKDSRHDKRGSLTSAGKKEEAAKKKEAEAKKGKKGS
jgi:hypothetical protein